MDLVSTVRKEGSRGGRGDFQWSEVQTSQHRENYLGHSLMAPVGRWQKKKDLSWYAKAGDDNDDDGLTLEERAAKERKEEFQRIKQAEKEALSKALGYEINEDGPLGGGGAGSGANSVAVAPKRIGPAAPPLEAKKERKEKRRDRSRSRERRHYERREKHHHRSRRYRSLSRSASRGGELDRRDRDGDGDRRRRRTHDHDDRRARPDDRKSSGHYGRRDSERAYDEQASSYNRRRDGSQERGHRRRSPSPYRELSNDSLRDKKTVDDHRPDRRRSRSRPRSYERRRERTVRRSRSP